MPKPRLLVHAYIWKKLITTLERSPRLSGRQYKGRNRTFQTLAEAREYAQANGYSGIRVQFH